MFALLANQRTHPSVDSSKLPSWAKKVIERAHQPPLINFDKIFENEPHEPESHELDKLGKVTQKVVKTELKRLKAHVESANDLDEEGLAELA